MWFVIPYYHKIFISAVLERWLIYDCDTECSFVYLISDLGRLDLQHISRGVATGWTVLPETIPEIDADPAFFGVGGWG